MARNGRKKVIYKGTFVSIQTLIHTGIYIKDAIMQGQQQLTPTFIKIKAVFEHKIDEATKLIYLSIQVIQSSMNFLTVFEEKYSCS